MSLINSSGRGIPRLYHGLLVPTYNKYVGLSELVPLALSLILLVWGAAKQLLPHWRQSPIPISLVTIGTSISSLDLYSTKNLVLGLYARDRQSDRLRKEYLDGSM